MNLTPAQHQAIYTHDRNIIVLAGAGSGKTRVLVERYLALLRANPWPLNALVAITFTKKAAGEMRDRVRQALENAYQAAQHEHERARWGELLASMDSARIETIHGLCTALLRANAAAAGVDPDFTVLDETDAVLLLDDVINSTLVDLVAEDDPAVALFREYDSSVIRAVLGDPAARQASQYPMDADALRALWEAQWAADVPQHTQRFLAKAAQVGTVEPALDDAIGNSWAVCLERLEALHNNPSVAAIITALTAIEGLPMRGGSAKKWGGQEQFDHAKHLLKALRTLAADTLEAIGPPPGSDDDRAAALLMLWARLLNRVTVGYNRAKTAASLLDFDDLERLTCALLSDPEVCRRYREGEYRHLLVDEFQDTNAQQWTIIQALTGLENPGRLFVVGDEKQSIYAFRGADVSVFGEVRGQIDHSGGVLINMVASFRTHQPLVTRLNAIFGRLLLPDPDSPVREYQVELGQPMTAARSQPPDDAAPHLELLLIDAARTDDGDSLTSEDRRRREAAEIALRLQAMIADKRPIYDKQTRQVRPMHYGDVAVLFQSLSHVTLYEDVFKSLGMRYVTVAGRGYYDRQEVWDMINLLNTVYNPADDLALMSALRSPLFGLSDDALLALRLTADDLACSLWEALPATNVWLPPTETETLAWAASTLYALRAAAGRVSIAELLRDALARTGYLAVLTGLPDGERRRLNVEKLLDKALSSGKTTLGAFSAYLRDLSAREVREGEAALAAEGAVQIMSVHASKGLEFPVVVLADASWSRRGSGSAAVIADNHGRLACKILDENTGKLIAPFAYRRAQALLDAREAAERLRLFYVAATRAQDALIISGQVVYQEGAARWKASGWLGGLLEALDLSETLHSGRYEWGMLHLVDPQEALAVTPQIAPTLIGWALPEVQAGLPISSDASRTPPLLDAVVVRRTAQARHLAATHIADLGALAEAAPEDHPFYRARFRRQVLQAAPTTVEWVSQREQHVSARIVGEIVHEALRWWRFPGDVPDSIYYAQLISYAWRHGLSDERLCENAARRAYRLLEQTKAGDVYRWISDAAAVYRELPFIYEREGHIVHGIIDVLFRRRDGTWAVVDYKTSTVPDAEHDPGLVTQHARRYHLQLGVYADAVRQQLGGEAPETFIHYIRYMHTVSVNAADWQRALSRSIGQRIAELVDFNEDKTR